MIDTINGNLFVDDRGTLRFVNGFNFANIKRFYQVENHHKGFIRAWHGHLHEGKFAYVCRGTAWFGIIDMETGEQERVILTDKQPKILYIPPGKYNGFKTMDYDTIILFFSTSTIEESKGDDIRVPYETYPMFQEKYR